MRWFLSDEFVRMTYVEYSFSCKVSAIRQDKHVKEKSHFELYIFRL